MLQDDHTIITVCQCHTFSHQARFIYDEDLDAILVEVKLNAYMPWWRRLWHAFLYVVHGKDADYDQLILSKADSKKLMHMCERASR